MTIQDRIFVLVHHGYSRDSISAMLGISPAEVRGGREQPRSASRRARRRPQVNAELAFAGSVPTGIGARLQHRHAERHRPGAV